MSSRRSTGSLRGVGIEILLRAPLGSPSSLGRVVANARRAAREFGMVELPGPSNADSIRLVLQRPAGKRFELTVQLDGETHAQSFGEPRESPQADTAVIAALLPGLTIVGSNPSWEPPEPPDPSWHARERGSIEE